MSYRKYAYKGKTPQYYYEVLSRTETESWATGDYFKKRDDGSPGSAKCVMGQLGVRYSMTPDQYPEDANGLLEMFRTYLDVEPHHVNDGLEVVYNYKEDALTHPKQRILSAVQVCEDIHYIAEMLLEDPRKGRALLGYLHRNPDNIKLGEYTITKTQDIETNLLYKQNDDGII